MDGQRTAAMVGGGSLNVIPHAVVLWFGCLLVGLPMNIYRKSKVVFAIVGSWGYVHCVVVRIERSKTPIIINKQKKKRSLK